MPKADISPVGHNVVPVPVYSRNHRKLDGYLRTRPFRFGSASTRARDKSRERKHVPHNRFCYMLINANRNLVVLGERHHASLEEIDIPVEWLADWADW